MTTNEKILEHYKLIYKVLSDMRIQNQKRQEEYFFDGLMGLYNGIRTYSKQKSKKSTYYYTCIKNEIVKRFYYNEKEKRNHKKYDISINTPLSDTHTIEDTLISDVNIEEEIIKKEQLELIYKTLNETKNTRFKQYLYEFYGINQPRKKIKEIALKYGVSEHNVSTSIRQGIKRIRKKVLEEYYGKNKKNKTKIRS